jgi:hypothetical protein
MHVDVRSFFVSSKNLILTFDISASNIAKDEVVKSTMKVYPAIKK